MINFRKILNDHVAHPVGGMSDRRDAWYCRSCDQMMHVSQVEGHAIQKLEEAEQELLQKKMEYRAALMKIDDLSREDNNCCGGWTDPEGALESIRDVLGEVLGMAPAWKESDD